VPSPACVVLYGNSTTGLGGWCYAESFSAAGWRVVVVDDSVGLEAYSRGYHLRVYRKVFNHVRPRDRAAHIAELHGAVRTHRPQIVVVLRGTHVGPSDVRKMRAAGAWVVNINHDDYFSQTRSNRSALLTAALPDYDYLFSPRAVNCHELSRINPRVAFFPFSFHPPIHRPVPIPEPETGIWKTDVSFVGTYAPHRASLLERLVQTHKGNYAIFGADWHKLSRRSPLRPYVRMYPVMMDDLAKALGGASVSLGFLRKENRDEYTQRTFEIPACGGVLLAERTLAHQTFFREGVEAEFFDVDRPDELAEQVRRLVGDATHRESVRVAGMKAVCRLGFTYQDRVAQLLTLFEASARP
jgi:spore maturation protein CgeB